MKDRIGKRGYVMGKMGAIFSFGRAYWKRFQEENKKIDIGLAGPRISIPVKIDSTPRATRSGNKPGDKSEFYTSNLDALYAIYNASITNEIMQRRLAYVEFIELNAKNYNTFSFDSISVGDVKVEFLGSYYITPPTISSHRKEAIETFTSNGRIRKISGSDCSTYENNESVRIFQFDRIGVMRAERARYFDQVGTNLTLDWDSGAFSRPGMTLRADIEPPRGGRLVPLTESVLANTLGVCVMFLDEELRPILRVRNPEELAAIPKRGLHCTVSGVFEIPSDRRPGCYGFDFFGYGVSLEIANETGLTEGEFELLPVGFARELPRGGKPQMFFVAISGLSESELRERARNAPEAYEYVDGEAVNLSLDVPTGGDYFGEMEEKCTYEGLMMLYLTDKFVSANRNELRESIARLKALRSEVPKK